MPEAHNALAGDPGALSPLKGVREVLLVTGNGRRPHAGCAEDRAARRCLTAGTGASPRAAPSPALPGKWSLAAMLDDARGQVIPGRRAGADQRAGRHARASHLSAAAHRARIITTADHPAQGDTWVVRTTARSGNVVVGARPPRCRRREV